MTDPAPASPVPTFKKPFILVVDDDEIQAQMVCEFLESAGYRVTTAADGWQAVVQAESVKIELIVSDVIMPGMHGSGIDTYRMIRASNYVRRDLPLIFMTGSQDVVKKHMQEIAKDPKVRILYKPLDLPKLRAAVVELVGH